LLRREDDAVDDVQEGYSLVLPDDAELTGTGDDAPVARRPIRVYVNGVEQHPAQAVGSFLAARAIRDAVPAEDAAAAEDAVVGGKVTVSTPFCTGTGIR
jgi:hypothetical protein